MENIILPEFYCQPQSRDRELWSRDAPIIPLSFGAGWKDSMLASTTMHRERCWKSGTSRQQQDPSVLLPYCAIGSWAQTAPKQRTYWRRLHEMYWKGPAAFQGFQLLQEFLGASQVSETGITEFSGCREETQIVTVSAFPRVLSNVLSLAVSLVGCYLASPLLPNQTHS